MPEIINMLADMDYDEVSLCASGQNQEAKIMLFKSDNGSERAYLTGAPLVTVEKGKGCTPESHMKFKVGKGKKCKACGKTMGDDEGHTTDEMKKSIPSIATVEAVRKSALPPIATVQSVRGGM